jgi:hypothetical protein
MAMFWAFVAGLSLGWLTMLVFVAMIVGNKGVK